MASLNRYLFHRLNNRFYCIAHWLVIDLGSILLNRNFNQQQSNTHWVGDITYIKTYQG
jgi:transposase InsO family protein